MQHRFFALISRMRYIGRWGLMRNTFEENIQEHSHMVAVLAHGLAGVPRDLPAPPPPPPSSSASPPTPTAARLQRCSTTRRRS